MELANQNPVVDLLEAFKSIRTGAQYLWPCKNISHIQV